MPAGPTARQIELFRTLEDIHDMTDAVVVLLVDAGGTSIAVSGDEDEFPAPLRAVLSGTRLAQAGSIVALVSPIAAELANWPVNVKVSAIGGGYVLAVAFDTRADLVTVDSVVKEATGLLFEILHAKDL
jgi:hypothetical protein